MSLADDYLVWHARLTREAEHWTRDRAAAEDLASAALEKCLQAERRGQDIGITYAYRSLRSCWLDQWRRSRVVAWVELTDTYPAPGDPLTELQAQALLVFLPARHQQIYLWIAAGYHQSEIAAMLGITLDAYKHRLLRMRRYARRAGLAA